MAVILWTLLCLMIFNVQCQQQIPKPVLPGDEILYPEDYCAEIEDYEEFDFIVVGAGPAGSAVARRLAELPANKVLLLEAGGDPPSASDVPGDFAKLGPEIRWNFHTSKDNYSCFGYTGNVCKYVPGKVLGGSSVVNAMMYVRGNKEDFEEWERMGNYGWGYEDVLPYFKKLENYLAQPIVDSETETNCRNADWKINGYKNNSSFCNRNEEVSSRYHSTGGPLTISSYNIDPMTNGFRQAILESIQENGVPYNNDVNGANQIGVTNLPGMIDPLGYRNNVAKAYLLNIPNNLKVCKNALVHKVNIDPSTAPKVVKSVKFVYTSKSNSAKSRPLHAVARKEYILSGGALNSPGILERSGIGLPEVLKAAGVEPIHKLNVGEKFQDQFGTAASAFALDYRTKAAANPLTMQLTSLTAFLSFDVPEVPDTQLYFGPYLLGAGKAKTYKPDIAHQYDSVVRNASIILFSGAILRQSKFGSVHITQSEDPLHTPKIILNQLSAKRDIDLVVKFSRFVRNVMSHEVLRPFKVKPFVMNECKNFTFNSEDEIMCGVRLLPSTLYHQAGTCYMGPANDSNSVVDPELRVIGTKNLRVADSSIMPLVTRGNTEIPAVMIGEKAADLIKKFWEQL